MPQKTPAQRAESCSLFLNAKSPIHAEPVHTDYKADKGGRGVGRLLWLKAFEHVNVESVYRHDKIQRRRTFGFTPMHGVAKEQINEVPDETKRATRVHLAGFRKRFREACYKSAQSIATSLFEHCLWYFVREGGAPHIVVEDGGQQFKLDDIYEQHMVSSAETETVTIKNRPFDLTHIKLRANSSHSHVLALCAANRLVEEENLTGKVPGLYGTLKDEHGDFVYACYITSEFLDETVRPERTGFDIDDRPEQLFAETEISLSDIRAAAIDRASTHLSSYLQDNRAKAKERVETYVSRKAPRYRPILNRIPEDDLNLDPKISDKELELTLHRHLAEIEQELLSAGHDVLQPHANEELADYRKRLNKYLQTVEDIKKSDLANYVSHRRVILDLLEKAIQRKEDGKYYREEFIHNLIMPMRSDSNEVMPDDCNLWIIDERLAFHNYLTSDKTLTSMPITGSTETKEPDLCALNVFDNPLLVSEGDKLPMASIVVIEIKRPMRNDAVGGEDDDPVEQALGYVNRIRNGQVSTASGRPIPESENIPGFCHVICDITPSVQARCEFHDAIITSDRMGYFFYHKNFKTYVEVISFDRLVNAAKERNRAFFDQLGLPST